MELMISLILILKINTTNLVEINLFHFGILRY